MRLLAGLHVRRRIPHDRRLQCSSQIALGSQLGEAVLTDDDRAALICAPAETFVAHEQVVLARLEFQIRGTQSGDQVLLSRRVVAEQAAFPHRHEQSFAQQTNI